MECSNVLQGVAFRVEQRQLDPGPIMHQAGRLNPHVSDRLNCELMAQAGLETTAPPPSSSTSRQ